MNKVIKEVDIKNCTYHMNDTQWEYKIIQVATTPTYIAELYILDDYDGYLARWKDHETSPKFTTIAEAEAYAQREWVK